MPLGLFCDRIGPFCDNHSETSTSVPVILSLVAGGQSSNGVHNQLGTPPVCQTPGVSPNVGGRELGRAGQVRDRAPDTRASPRPSVARG